MTPKVSFIAVFITMNVTPKMIDTNCENDVDIIAKLNKMENQIAELQNQVNQVNQNIRIEFTNLREQVTQIQTKVIETHSYNTPFFLEGRVQPHRPCTIL